jgi:hypothetical protein
MCQAEALVNSQTPCNTISWVKDNLTKFFQKKQTELLFTKYFLHLFQCDLDTRLFEKFSNVMKNSSSYHIVCHQNLRIESSNLVTRNGVSDFESSGAVWWEGWDLVLFSFLAENWI